MSERFEPRRPALVALGLCALWIVVLSIPMWGGYLLAGPLSDQYLTGYAWRSWQAEQWRALGHIPLWNPYIFGGMPYVGGMHGDIFYPTATLRLLLPTWFAMNVGFVTHYVLAGFFTYLLARKLGTSWAGAVIAGMAYQLSGVIGSYVQPGHDGKLYVTALLPLALLALLIAVRDRRFEGYGLLALAVGLAMLSPHPQMTQYMLIAAGLFALYLTFGQGRERSVQRNAADLALALGAVSVGFAIGAIQMMPFFEYIPFSPRAESYRGFEGATSFAIPWQHVPEFLFADFVGQSGARSYWGPNGLKLHSEYLGLPLVALAVLGATGPRRRLIWWLGGIGVLFLLVSLGSGTPFYRLWYVTVPFVKQTRAPGMALFVVALVLSLLAAFGVERLQARKASVHPTVWLVAGGAVVLVALVGGVGGLASFLAQGLEQSMGAAPQVTGFYPTRVAMAAADQIRWGAFVSGGALMLVGALGVTYVAGRVSPSVMVFALAVLVSGDLWWNARPFWVFTDAHRTLHAPDRITNAISETTPPYRVLVFPPTSPVYPQSSLMKHNIPQLLGHHGNELDRFDKLMGGKNAWENWGNPNLWELFAINYVITPVMEGFDSIPGYTRTMSGEMASFGVAANLFEREEPIPYARVVSGAVKWQCTPDQTAEVCEQQLIATVIDPRFVPDQLVLIDSAPADLNPPALDSLPPALDHTVTVGAWEPGAMSIVISPPITEDAFLVVSENWYPDWRASIDGQPGTVVRGDGSLLAVPLQAGASQVELEFRSAAFSVGKVVTLLSFLLAVGAGAVPPLLRRRVGG